MQEPYLFALSGGLDLETSPMVLPPGRSIAAINYESCMRGFRRSDGYERFDGRLKPSEANYWVLDFDAGTAAIVTGNTVTGGTSGATGIALLDAIVDSGTYGGSDAAGRLILSEVSGTFQDNEALKVGGVTKSTANGTALSHGATNDDDEATWQALAIERRRALIAAVPGSGPVRGVWIYKGSVYALRDDAGATACILFKESTSGWVSQNLGREVAFTSGGTYVIAEGNTITGATSAATATVGRVILTSGDWAAGTAAGRLILTAQTGNLTAENLNVGANLNVATIAANSTAHALLPGGRFDFENYNFRGSASTVRMYAADGVNRAWEWDGTVFVPIITGIADDTPDYIAAHKKHLMLGFKEGSVQTSDIGEPYSYTALGGAVEIAVGFELTGLMSDVAGLLAIFCKDAVVVLYGTDADTWDLSSLAEDAKSYAFTMQMVGTPLYMDDQGVRSLQTTQAYGDFQIGTMTRAVHKLFETKKKASVTPVASIRSRTKDQYRLFFSDGTGITIYFGKKAPEPGYFDLGLIVACSCSGPLANDNEGLFIGDEDGMVHQLDSGTSHDGDPLDAYIRLGFVTCGSPVLVKRFHKVTLEVDAPANCNISMTADFDYGRIDNPPVGDQDFTVEGGGGFWDEANWNEFYWDASANGLAEAYFDGEGCNISVVVASSTTYEESHILQGMRLHYSKRRLQR